MLIAVLQILTECDGQAAPRSAGSFCLVPCLLVGCRDPARRSPTATASIYTFMPAAKPPPVILLGARLEQRYPDWTCRQDRGCCAAPTTRRQLGLRGSHSLSHSVFPAAAADHLERPVAVGRRHTQGRPGGRIGSDKPVLPSGWEPLFRLSDVTGGRWVLPAAAMPPAGRFPLSISQPKARIEADRHLLD